MKVAGINLRNDDLLSEKQQPRLTKLANNVVCWHVMAWTPRFNAATTAWLHVNVDALRSHVEPLYSA